MFPRETLWLMGWLVMAGSGALMMSVVEAELFVGFGSVAELLTAQVLVRLADGVLAVTVKETVAAALLARLPRLQITAELVNRQEPWLDMADTKVNCAAK